MENIGHIERDKQLCPRNEKKNNYLGDYVDTGRGNLKVERENKANNRKTNED